MAVDPAFKGVGKKDGLEIFRIEKFQVIPQPKNTHGKFHSGDSYIVLHTKKLPAGFEWNIHFWLGEETSQDEAGVAAYKTVELDDSLGGGPVQHREVQHHESNKFLSYFSKGVTYLAGGIESGFKKVDRDKFETRLLHVKGRRNVRVSQTQLSWAAMNDGDVFILDMGRQIYVWNGLEAGRLEKIKGLDVARRIKDEERGGRAEISVINQDSMSDEFVKTMNATADGTPRDIQAATDDSTFERKAKDLVKLYQVSDASGFLEINEVGNYPLKRDMLDTNDAFIVDTGSGGIFAWVGKRATRDEKKAAFKNAVDFITKKGYPNWTNVTQVLEGAETPLFKQNFVDWLNKDESKGYSMPKAGPKRLSQPKFDVGSMHRAGQREQQNLVDDGKGKVEIWRIEDFEMAPVDPGMYGQFFGGDSYVILYTYLKNGKENYIIYFWQGQESSQDEKAAAALHAVHLDDQYGGAPVQVRVVQNKEPDHFLLIFKGKMVVHSGGKASGFKNRNDTDSYDVDGTRLFHVRGTNEFNTRAVQVPEVAASLNSNDCFVLETPGDTYIWYGKGCTGDERELANFIVSAVSPGRDPVKLFEGKEAQEFWDSLGGKTAYASGKILEEPVPSHPPRLFQCSNASGRFNVEEIFDYSQEDLVPEDVMILDTYDQVFVWIGRGANEVEKKEGLQTAQQYVEGDPSGRDIDSTALIQIKQGFEPPNFTCYFHAWNPAVWRQDSSYETYLQKITSTGETEATSVQDELAVYSKTYKLEELLNRRCPPGVDPTCKENYLTPEDFKKAFEITIDQFRTMPKWKQLNLKKKVGIF
ncbi:gelsolin, cytoplasmic-like [Dysidea avara]|uniref:gelsolin, cytoplasmic-like n=1 Tax=Dysidea avara TaxID=196820 RepID=UPI00333452C9